MIEAEPCERDALQGLSGPENRQGTCTGKRLVSGKIQALDQSRQNHSCVCQTLTSLATSGIGSGMQGAIVGPVNTQHGRPNDLSRHRPASKTHAGPSCGTKQAAQDILDAVMTTDEASWKNP